MELLSTNSAEGAGTMELKKTQTERQSSGLGI